jgi:hypothetical protein
MWEFLAVCAGIAIGAGTAGLQGRRRGITVALLSVIGGIAISTASGEIAESPAFALFDIGQVLLASVLTAALVARMGFGHAHR